MAPESVETLTSSADLTVKVLKCNTFPYFKLETELTADFAAKLVKIIKILNQHKVAFNLLFNMNHFLLIPRRHEGSLERMVYFGMFEFLGIVIDYAPMDNYTEEDYLRDLKELSCLEFKDICLEISSLLDNY